MGMDTFNMISKCRKNKETKNKEQTEAKTKQMKQKQTTNKQNTPGRYYIYFQINNSNCFPLPI